MMLSLLLLLLLLPLLPLLQGCQGPHPPATASRSAASAYLEPILEDARRPLAPATDGGMTMTLEMRPAKEPDTDQAKLGPL